MVVARTRLRLDTEDDISRLIGRIGRKINGYVQIPNLYSTVAEINSDCTALGFFVRNDCVSLSLSSEGLDVGR